MLSSASQKYFLFKVAFILWVQLFFSPILIAQSPSHFFIGENELAGIDIYSVYKAQNQDLFIGTSNGVFCNKQGEFQELIKSPLQRGSSFFQIQENSKGQLFCSNLHGQLFELTNDSIRLFFELPEDEIGDQFHFFIDSENNFVYASKVIGKISPTKQKTIVARPHHNAENSAQYFHASTIGLNKYFIGHSQLDSSIIYNNGTIKHVQLPNEIDKDVLTLSSSLSLIQLNNKEVFVNNTGSFYSKNVVCNEITANPSERFININENKILALNSKSGARFIYLQNDTLKESKSILNNLFISAADIDDKGRLYLGTFGNGVCIVPNINNSSIPIKASLRGVSVSKNGICYVSSKEGKLFKIKGDSTTIIHESNRTQDWIFHCNNCGEEEIDKLIYDPFNDGKSGVLKDFYYPESENKGFIATSIGIFAIGQFPETNKTWSICSNNKFYRLNKVSGRQKSVAYNYKRDLLYYSDESKLFKVNLKGESKTLLWKNKNIAANDLELIGDTLVCATENNGLLFFHNDTAVHSLSSTEGLIDTKIKKIKIIGNRLLILSQGGFQTLHLPTLKLQTYGVPEGLIENTIIDFGADKNQMYFLIKNKVLILPYAHTEILPEDIKLEITNARVGNISLSKNKESIFPHTSKKLELSFDFKSELLTEETTIFYKLIGADDDWNQISVNAKSIQYQSLAPGYYVLEVETRCRNVVSEKQLFSFKIKAPFWQQWWFYLAITLSLILLSFLFYRRRLKVQNTKLQQINELNSSKLTAIQSQMNPHFIFNALNSIQALVLKGDVENSYTFITKFSNLVRRTLNYSDKDFIRFSQEIKLIELYLSLEKLRFKEDLEYEIIENDIDDINVPPMLIQPFIENALLYGLLHKSGEKKITISFTLEETLVCTITDNGIGRKKSEEIKKRQRSEHESFSGNAIKRRFAILEKQFGGNLGFTYTDLEENNSSCGTQVVLRIPIKKEF